MEGFLKMHSSRKYPYNPRKGIGIFSGWVGSLRLKYLKKCIKVNFNFTGGRDPFCV